MTDTEIHRHFYLTFSGARMRYGAIDRLVNKEFSLQGSVDASREAMLEGLTRMIMKRAYELCLDAGFHYYGHYGSEYVRSVLRRMKRND